jgi:gamma-glutamyltranspeptidase/glutathione hydrolase
MSRIVSRLLVASVVAALIGCSSPQKAAAPNTAVARRGMVACVHPLAAEAGVNAFKRGGNAVDAAIATCLTLGVVDGHNSGIGGGCFILIYRKNGEVLCIDGREMAPAKATRDMFIRNGHGDTSLSQNGPLAVATPGALMAYHEAVRTAGKMNIADLLLPAADLAERGFPIDEVYERKLKASAPQLARFPASKSLLFHPDGSTLKKGETLKQPDLANTYRNIADKGLDWFYRGEFAQKVGDWMAANGGVLSAADFANYHTLRREPVVTTYRGRTIIGMPPVSSGGVHMAQILNMLERFDLAAMSPADRTTTIANAMSLAFADRAYWLGDLGYVKVPRGLIDKAYAAELAKQIDPKKALKVKGHGNPPRAAEDIFSQKHTTHIAAADSEGNFVAITQTINTGFGSKVIVPGTGVLLNDEMDDFSIEPGVPNAFKLVGADANAVEPGKRPLSSMSPTIILQDGKPVMTIGAAGGPKIITQVLLGIVNHFDLGMDLGSALAQPRFHHQWSPDSLMVEKTMDPALMAELKARGFELMPLASSATGSTNAVAIEDGQFIGAHEPRVPGKAAGY